MRTALDNAVAALKRDNERISTVAVHLVDRFKITRDANDLDALKNFVRLGIQDAESQLSTYRNRDGRRSRHFKARIRRKPELGPRLDPHLGVLRTRAGLYQDRRSQLRQAADAAVWIMLDFDIRRLAMLHKDTTHDLPENIGLAGVIQLQADLHKSGHFLVMENDLTRCCGVGDITVVRSDGRRIVPLLLEVKTHAESKELAAGSEVGILSLTSSGGSALDKETLDLLSDTIGGDPPEDLIVSARAERQAEEIRQRAELMARMMSSGATVVDPPERNWASLQRVIERALTLGLSFDFAERGVYYFAIRIDVGESPERAMREVKERVTELLGAEAYVGLNLQLQEQGDLSGLIPPIALWDLPLHQRAALQAGRVIAGGYVESALFADLFTQHGIQLTETEDGWTLVAGDGKRGGIGPLLARAVRLGTVIGALSPASVVNTLAAGMTMPQANL